MPKSNRTRYSILGLLSLRPMSGYDIRQVIENSLNYFWAESYSQIYPTLKQMAESGLATFSIKKEDGKPDRKVFTITDAGKAELRAWLADSPTPESRRNELLLKLTFGAQINSERMEAHLKSELERLQAGLAELEALQKQFENPDPTDIHSRYQLITVGYGIAMTRALKAWADESIERIMEIEKIEAGQNLASQS